MEKSEIIKRAGTDRYQELFAEALQMYPEDPFKQLDHLKTKGSEHLYLLALLQIARRELHNTYQENDFMKKICYEPRQVEGLLKAFLGAVSLNQDNIQDEVYGKMVEDCETFAKKSINSSVKFDYLLEHVYAKK